VRLSCLARNGRSPGEESLTDAVAVQAIEAQPAFGQIKPMRGQVLACDDQHFGDVPASDRPTQETPHSRRRKSKPGVQKGGPVVAKQTEASAGATDHWVAVCRRDQLVHRSVREDRDIAVLLTTAIRADPNRGTTDPQSHLPRIVAPIDG
jgi:hypothetical protein